MVFPFFLKFRNLILTFLFLIICGLNIIAIEHLNFNGFIADNAGILSEQTEIELNTILSELQNKTKADVAVVTIHSLQGDAIENVSLKIARKYKLGDKKLNNGVLILVALNDRKVRIEIGYGLEGSITDAHSGQILDDYVIPRFKEGDYEKGIVDGTLVLANDIAKSYGQELSISSTLPASSIYTTHEAATLAEMYQIIRDTYTAEDDGTGTIIFSKIMFSIFLIMILFGIFYFIFVISLHILNASIYLIIPIINIFIVKFKGKPINIKKLAKKIDKMINRYCGSSSHCSSSGNNSHSSHSSSSSHSFGGSGEFGGGGSSRNW